MFEERDGFDGKPGTKEYFSLRIGELPNGAPVQMPVIVVNGVEDGPTLFVNACLHGDEILGADVVRRTARDLDPTQMGGRFITVPMANPAAFGSRTRRNIHEMYPGPEDMNRIWPGDPQGIMASRLADTIGEKFIYTSDYVFDLHCASVGGLWEPYSIIPPADSCVSPEHAAKAEAFARSFGATTVLTGGLTHGSLIAPATERGIVASMAEFGWANTIDEENLAVGLRGVTNLLKHTGIIEGEPEMPERQYELKKLHRMRTDRGGFVKRTVTVGDTVAAGQLLVELEDLKGDTIAEFRAPADGRVCRVNTMGVLGTGDIVLYVAETD